MGIAVHKKDTMRVKEDIALASNKPNIHELLWNTVEVRGMDIRAENDKIGVKGELFIFALYRGDDDNNSLQWLEHSGSLLSGIGMCGLHCGYGAQHRCDHAPKQNWR